MSQITSECRDEFQKIISDTALDYHQKRAALAYAAENSLPYPAISLKARDYLERKIICDLNEGHAPYRPRYIVPDYQKFMKQGSEYLNLQPPRDLFEAVGALLVLYRYVPSVTGFPVYLGPIDTLLEPFMEGVSSAEAEAEAEKLLRLFLINIDRTLPDAFVHMNIGPAATKTGKLLLRLERLLQRAVPNLSLKVDETTDPEFVQEAIVTALEVGKPYFVNHAELTKVWGEGYAVASCYNTLKIGGGSYTLVRLNLKEVAGLASGYQDFMEKRLPEAIDLLCEIINRRISFVVETAKFFETSFLVREGLLDQANFTAMAGVFGLYECVETLSGGLRMGFDAAANEMARAVTERAYSLVKEHEGAYCAATNGKIGFHAQSGIDTDLNVTAGVRVKTGAEPDLLEQIRLAGQLQTYFDTGVSDIYLFDRTARRNPAGVFKIISGALKQGVRIMAINSGDGAMVRITGYLVKRSDIDKYFRGEPLREGTVKLGAESVKNQETLRRIVRSVNEGPAQ